ncbi:hypothetical protein [Actinobaculum massiliense]|uniref:hypothetical protein n=1 Tax=Actinobaculum massiliense TaxID=202789 RepID=UPI0012DF9477|nr:hypothetical protein [Actinobaculum massiliense]MDK8318597.1 hypothetical protein [Actinobaculum massiliense]MDK8567128.1 hypothetical protein [Actinobaculum massiliense]
MNGAVEATDDGTPDGRGLGVAAHYGNPLAEQRELACGRAVVDLSHARVECLGSGAGLANSSGTAGSPGFADGTGAARNPSPVSSSGIAAEQNARRWKDTRRGRGVRRWKDVLEIDSTGRIRYGWVRAEAPGCAFKVSFANFVGEEVPSSDQNYFLVGASAALAKKLETIAARGPGGEPLVWIDSWPATSYQERTGESWQAAYALVTDREALAHCPRAEQPKSAEPESAVVGLAALASVGSEYGEPELAASKPAGAERAGLKLAGLSAWRAQMIAACRPDPCLAAAVGAYPDELGFPILDPEYRGGAEIRTTTERQKRSLWLLYLEGPDLADLPAPNCPIFVEAPGATQPSTTQPGATQPSPAAGQIVASARDWQDGPLSVALLNSGVVRPESALRVGDFRAFAQPIEF